MPHAAGAGGPAGGRRAELRVGRGQSGTGPGPADDSKLAGGLRLSARASRGGGRSDACPARAPGPGACQSRTGSGVSVNLNLKLQVQLEVSPDRESPAAGPGSAQAPSQATQVSPAGGGMIVRVRPLTRTATVTRTVRVTVVLPQTGISSFPCMIQYNEKIHLEPCRPSISKVGPSISLYYDIKGATFDIEGRKMTFDIWYDITTRYRMF